MNKKNFYQLTLRIQKETYQILKQSSVESCLPIASIIRSLLEKFSKNGESSSIQETQSFANCRIPEELKLLYPLILENNLLLRKIGRHTNSQIVIEADDQIQKHFKKKEASESKKPC